MPDKHDYLVTPIPYSASATKSDKAPTDRRITEIYLELLAQHDTGATVSSNADAFNRVMSSLKVSGPGGTFYDISDLRLLFYYNLIRRNGRVRRDALTTTASQSNVKEYIGYFLHPGSDPENPYDLSAAILAEEFAANDIAVTWPANTQMGTGQTIDTTTQLSVSFKGVTGLPRLAQSAGPLFVPNMTTLQWTIDATYTNLGKKINVPTGNFMRSILVMVTDNTASPGDKLDSTRVTYMSLELPKESKNILVDQFLPLVEQSARYQVQKENSLTAGGISAGLVFLDLLKIIDPSSPFWTPWGIDMRSFQDGDLKLGFTIGTGNGNIFVLWDQLRKVK